MHTQTDYAWAAGIIDGEGCIFLSRHKPNEKNGVKVPFYTLSIKVTMGHEPTILKLREMFGSGSKHKVEQVGWNPAYTWIVSAKISRDVLQKIQPYIFTKKDELAVALEFLALPGWYGGQHRGPKSEEYQQIEYILWDKMRRLKPRTKFKIDKEERELESQIHRA